MFISVLVTAVILYVLLDFRRYGEYLETLARANFWILFAALIVHVVVVLLRAWRLSVMLGKRWHPPNAIVVKTSTLHHFFNSFLPARSGELALPVLLKQWHQVDYAYGVGILLLIRGYDLLVLMCFAGLSAFFAFRPLPEFEFAAWLGLAVAVGATAIAFTFPLACAWLKNLVELPETSTSKIRRIINDMLDASDILRRRKDLFALITATVAVWIPVFIVFELCAQALGIGTPLSLNLLAGSAAAFAVSMPVNGIANIGPMEAAWTSVMVWQGVPWDAAVVSGIVMHLILLAGTSLTALFVSLAIRSDGAGTTQSHRA